MPASSFHVSPTEPRAIKNLGMVSSTPEKHGVDIMWASARLGGFVGVQRKEIKDLIASVGDGRLAKEVAQMKSIKMSVLIVEGRPRWSTEGILMQPETYTRWTNSGHRNLLLSLQMEGVWVLTSEDVNDTVACVLDIARWCEKTAHTTLSHRPKPRGNWGAANDRDYQIHLAQSIPGIGPGLAAAMVDHFGGSLPIGWLVSKKELLKVPGMGKQKVEQAWRALQEFTGPELPEPVDITG